MSTSRRPLAPAPDPTAVDPRIRTLFVAAAVTTFLATAMGSVVCATESGAACPTWPGCYPDRVTPLADINPIIEFTHRVVAILAGLLLIAAAVASTRLRAAARTRQSAWLLMVLPWVALVCAGASAVFGRIVVLSHLPLGWGVLDLFAALVAMCAMSCAALAAGTPGAPWRATRIARLAAGAGAVVIVMHLLGLLVAGAGSYTRCMGWPMWKVLDGDVAPALQVVRIGLALVALALVAGTFAALRSEPAGAPAGAALTLLVIAELILGLTILNGHLNWPVAAAYSVLAVTIVWALALIAGRSARGGDAGQPAVSAAPTAAGRSERLGATSR